VVAWVVAEQVACPGVRARKIATTQTIAPETHAPMARASTPRLRTALRATRTTSARRACAPTASVTPRPSKTATRVAVKRPMANLGAAATGAGVRYPRWSRQGCAGV